MTEETTEQLPTQLGRRYIHRNNLGRLKVGLLSLAAYSILSGHDVVYCVLARPIFVILKK